MTPFTRIAFRVAMFMLLVLAAWRDIRYEKLYPIDLRNRVVGARLIYDGKLPYFYKWQQQDGMRYYDPQNIGEVIISNITASPFLHELMLPFCNLSQRTISIIWLYLQYAILISMGLLAWKYSRREETLLVTAAFPFTDAWVRHIITGQYYLLIPFLLFLIYILLSRWKKPWMAAALAVMLVLIRPFAAVFFIPMLFILPETRRFIIACFVIGAAYALFVLASPFQRELYKDYDRYLKLAVRAHQDKPVPHVPYARDPHFKMLEGFDMSAIIYNGARDRIPSRNEHGNFFVIYKLIFHKQLPEVWLMVGTLVSTLLILLFFYFATARGKRSLYQCMLAGFVIYMVAEMFLPVHRHQYNTVQFLFPLMLVAMHERGRHLVLISIGLLLNMINWEIFPMKNTVGELLMLAGCLWALTPPGYPKKHTPRRGWLKNFLYIIYLLLFTFFAAEIILRIYNPFPARVMGDKIILPANQTFYYHNDTVPVLDKEIRVKYNSLGFQGPEKPANYDSCLSIVTVGGSTTACMFISTENTWPTLLSNELSRSFTNVWLNNAGRDGHSSFGHMFMLRDHVLKLHPKVIIFLTGINDVDRTDLGIHEDSIPHSVKQFIMRNSEVANIIFAYLTNRKVISFGLLAEFADFRIKKFDTLRLPEDTIQKALRLQQPLVNAYEHRMRALIDTCLSHNIKPVLVTQPIICGNAIDTLSGMDLAIVKIENGQNGEQWSRKLDMYNDVLKKLAKEYGILCIDLAAMMPKSTRYYYDYVHYTNEGTKKVVELIAPQLEEYLRAQFPNHISSK